MNVRHERSTEKKKSCALFSCVRNLLSKSTNKIISEIYVLIVYMLTVWPLLQSFLLLNVVLALKYVCAFVSVSLLISRNEERRRKKSKVFLSSDFYSAINWHFDMWLESALLTGHKQLKLSLNKKSLFKKTFSKWASLISFPVETNKKLSCG